jgi:hypothetical protein
MATQDWHVIDGEAHVLWREYNFTKNATATTLVFRGADGLIVVSPATGLSDRDYDVLREHGEVRALIANNAFHGMGQAAWRARFPDAVSYAPDGALKSLGKKAPDLGYRPLSSLVLPDHVRCDVPPGFKTGETFLRIETSKGRVWFTGDLLTNVPRLPPPPLRWLFTWTDSGPGFRLFRPAVWLAVGDKKVLRSWMLERIESEPPAIVVTSHGPAFEAPDLPALARAQLERL